MQTTRFTTRAAAVSGMFYADNAAQLKSDIESCLSESAPALNIIPKALIVPHAGYIYSGPVAASAYKLLLPVADKINQVVLLGPSHRVAINGIATPDDDFFETPLGNIKINQQLCEKAEQLDFVSANQLAHRDEHSLEVHLPFLQVILNEFELTPLVVGDCNKENVSELLDLLWGDENTLIIISTDLSHFHNYATANAIDTVTSNAILQLDTDSIDYENACGRNPLNGLLHMVKQRQLTINLLDLRNSGDTAGDKNRVVGYGSYVVY